MSSFELVATGPEGQRWRQTLEPRRKVRIGRDASRAEWAVPWDQRISREHCDVQLEGDQLEVRCLESARNPAHVHGQPLREFSIREGESFRIGATTFHLGRKVEVLGDVAMPSGNEQAATPAESTSSIRQLKNEVEQLRAQLAAETESKHRRDEEERLKREQEDRKKVAGVERRKQEQEIADLRAKLEQMKAKPAGESSSKSVGGEPSSSKSLPFVPTLPTGSVVDIDDEDELKSVQLEAKRRIAEAAAKRKAEDEDRRIDEEQSRLQAAEEARQRAAEEARRVAEAERLAQEQARQQAEEDARRLAEAEALRQAEEQASLKTEEESRRRAEEEARRQAAEEARLAAETEARRLAEAEALRQAEEQARLKAEEESRRLAEEEARRQAAEEARLAAEAEAQRLADAEAQRHAEEQARLKAEEEAQRLIFETAARKGTDEARQKAEAEALAKRQFEEAEAHRRTAEAEAKRKALQEELRRLEEEEAALRTAEEEAHRQAEAEAQRIAAAARREAELAEQQRIEAESLAQRQAAEIEARRVVEEQARLQAEVEARRQAEEEAQRIADAARREAELAEQKRIDAEALAQREAEEAETARRVEERRRKAEAEKFARQQAEDSQARRVADEQARRQAEEEAQRIAVAARREAELAEQKRIDAEAFAKRQADEASVADEPIASLPLAAPIPVETPPDKPATSVEALKAKLAAQAAAKKQAKASTPVAPAAGKADSTPVEAKTDAHGGTIPAPAEASKPKAGVEALKAQLAAQAAAKKKDKSTPPAIPAAADESPADPGTKKVDIAALKAELAAKKAGAAKGPDGKAVKPGLGSEDRFEESLQAQLNAGSVSLGGAALKPAAPGKPAKPAIAPKVAAKAKETVAGATGDDPKKYVWQLLPEKVRETVRRIAGGGMPTDDEKRQIAGALNRIIKDRELLAVKALEKTFEHERVAGGTKSFPKGLKGLKKDWSELEVRAAARLAFQVLYPTTRTKKRKRKMGPPRTLAYLSRSEIFGEMGALLDQPRSATCVAYDHPLDDSSRKPGRVELVRIGAEVFKELLTASAGFRAEMEKLVAERQQRSMKAVEERPWDENSSLKSLPEFEQLGLVQGQKLMLIDLDRCTRCGDCVRACINTHDDGYSRLFLDGPRFDRFLVPSACRKCLNPSCMIGCPVGSIQRGDDDEILIRDWCIGCGLCARQCPYDSIQMHDLGIIPEKSLGWRFQLGASVTQANWNQPGFRDSLWPSGPGPFPWDLNLQLPLSKHTPTFLGPTLEDAVYFRYEFEIPKSKLRGTRRYRLFLVSSGSTAEVWVNGKLVELPQDAKQRKKGEYEGNLAESLVRPGKNLVAVAVRPPVSFGETVLSLRLDMPPELTGDAALANELKLVTERAVVCDMCGTRAAGPACVAECPHDAAMRVDAQNEFPRS